MPHIRLTERKPVISDVELFTYPDDIDTWTETDSGTVTISVATVSSRTFMRFVTTAVTEGVYKDFTVTPAQKVNCSFFVKSTNDTDEFTAIIYDQTNGATITTYTPHTVDTTWRCFEIDFAAPALCTTIRVTLNGLVADTYEIDAFAFNKDEIVIQPGYSYDGNPDIVGVVKQSLSGNKVQHRLATHWRYALNWAFVEDDFFDRMVLLYENGETLYLDDGDVPDLTERSTLYTNATYDMTGITIPSTTHVGYYTESSDLPTSAAQFQDTEYPTAWYTDIGAGTLRSHEFSSIKYLYHKFIFRPSEYGSSVQRLAVNIKTIMDDLDVANNDGIIAYAWDGSAWREIFRTSGSAAEDITWYTYASDEAQSICPQEAALSNGIVRLLVRTRAYGDSLTDTSVSVYMSGNQTLTALNTLYTLDFDTKDHDVTDEFDTDTNAFTATSAGKYLIICQARFSVVTTGDVIQLGIYKNGSTTASAIAFDILTTPRAESRMLRVVVVEDLSAGDSIIARVINATSNGDVIDADHYFTFMTITGIAQSDSSLGMYYVSLETNPGLGAVEPSHRMFFSTNSESDDITVKNRTDGTTLTTSNYTIDYENNEIDITGQSDGDVMEYTYSRFREVRIAQMPTRRQHDTPAGAVRRGMQVILETTTGE